MNINGLDYNTQRERLILPEYGREIQNMVDYCVALPTKEERQRCAATIVAKRPLSDKEGCASTDTALKWFLRDCPSQYP